MGNHYDPKENDLITAESKPSAVGTRKPVQRFEDCNGYLYPDALQAIRSDIASLAAETSSRASQNDSGLDYAIKRLSDLLEEYRLARIQHTRMHPSRFGEKR